MRLADEGFCVGAAAYPEGHIECTDFRCIRWRTSSRSRTRRVLLRHAAVLRQRLLLPLPRIRRTCGRDGAHHLRRHAPLMSKAQVQRMVFMCGASLPAALVKLVAKYADAPDDPASGGHRVASAQAGRP